MSRDAGEIELRYPTMRALFYLLSAILLLAISCGGSQREEILVFTAASLTDVMERLGQQYAEFEGVKVSFNLAGSTALAQQIIRGAPADAFVSAGPHPMDALEERGLLVPGTRVDILTNELVLVGNAANEDVDGIVSAEGLASRDLRVTIADPELAPAGRYAREALKNLGLWRLFQPRLVPAANVRVALGYVKAGNVDVGIVYRTDARITEGLKVLAPIPKDSYSTVVYPAGVLEGSRQAAARKFLAFLRGADASQTFREYGFTLRNEE